MDEHQHHLISAKPKTRIKQQKKKKEKQTSCISKEFSRQA
jgi:hypothetical protein